MAGRVSCIYHPEGDDWIAIRKHLVDLFGGDVCLAALVSLFEFWTNGELTSFAKNREEGIPWVQVEMPVIEQWMMGLYGLRTIQDRLATLDQCGILKSTSSSGRSKKSYLLNIEYLNSLIRGQVKPPDILTGKIAGQISDQQNCRSMDSLTGKTDVKIAGQTDCYIGIEEFKKEEEEIIPPTPSLKNSKTDLSTRERTYFEPEEESSDWSQRQQNRSREYRKGKQQQSKEAKREQRRAENLAIHDRMEALRSGRPQDTPTTVPPAQVPSASPASPVLQSGPSCIESWNASFPDSAIDPGIYSNGSMPWPLRDGSLQSQMSAVISKVRSMRERGAEVSFGDLLKAEKGGGYRWQAILAGSWDWLCKSKKPTETLGERKAREAHDKLEALKRARTQNAGIPGDDVPHAGIPDNRPGN